MSYDVAIIGAGPAGMAAATLLAGQSARTVLLDENPSPGGQIYRAIESAPPALRAILGPDYTRGAALAASFRACGVEYRPGTLVWQITPDGNIFASAAGASAQVKASLVILATGAMERPVPVPGWTLPGVMTAGALQVLLKSAGLVAEAPVLAGSGPLLYLLAGQLVAAGSRPELLDTTDAANERAALALLPAALRGEGWRYLAKGLALKRSLKRAGIAIHRRVTDLSIEGETHAETVSFISGGRKQRLQARLVALHEGVIPAQAVARSIGCDFTWNDSGKNFAPVCDGWGGTSLEKILIAGDAAGVAGAVAAEHAGRLVAWQALHRLGRLTAVQRDANAAADRRAHAAHTAVRAFLDRLYAPPRSVLTPADGVTICRCEEVTAGALRAAAAIGCAGPNQAKSYLRVGMGPCQGRMCGPTVTTVLAEALGKTPDDIGHFRIRPPLKPITVGEIAALTLTD